MCSGGKLHSQAEDSKAVTPENTAGGTSLPRGTPCRTLCAQGEVRRTVLSESGGPEDCSHPGKEDGRSAPTSPLSEIIKHISGLCHGFIFPKPTSDTLLPRI